MHGRYKKLVGFMFVLVVLVSFYVSVVQIVNASGVYELIESFSVNSLRSLNSTGRFVMGDTLVFWAECGLADAYDLKIYENSSVVFEVKGEICNSSLEVFVSLYPPAFNAGNTYTAVLYVYVFNYPIPGAYYTDSAVHVFEVVGVETRLELTGEYDSVLHSLSLYANLTNVDGYPIANESVSFYLQFENGRRRLTDGWLPVGCAKTNASGMATLNFALNTPFDGYFAKACHEGDGNFGFSESYSNITVSSYFACESLNQHVQSGICIENVFQTVIVGTCLLR